jgi:hypothetical protein
VCQNKWQMLKGVAHYPKEKQSKIIMACFALHNYVHDQQPPRTLVVNRQPPRLSELSDQFVASSENADMALSPSVDHDGTWTPWGTGM